VGFFSFNRPEDVVGFVGVWTDFSFDRVEIREAVGGSTTSTGEACA
jgi:hypothetical protein